ncbi:MAG: hypothetical protein U7123_20800 [Potamolinea sp.]
MVVGRGNEDFTCTQDASLLCLYYLESRATVEDLSHEAGIVGGEINYILPASEIAQFWWN